MKKIVFIASLIIAVTYDGETEIYNIPFQN